MKTLSSVEGVLTCWPFLSLRRKTSSPISALVRSTSAHIHTHTKKKKNELWKLNTHGRSIASFRCSPMWWHWNTTISKKVHCTQAWKLFLQLLTCWPFLLSCIKISISAPVRSTSAQYTRTKKKKLWKHGNLIQERSIASFHCCRDVTTRKLKTRPKGNRRHIKCVTRYMWEHFKKCSFVKGNSERRGSSLLFRVARDNNIWHTKMLTS